MKAVNGSETENMPNVPIIKASPHEASSNNAEVSGFGLDGK